MDETNRHAPAAPTLDAVILAGLRARGGPVQAEAIPDVCRIRYSTKPRERQDSLDRLVAGGLVSRRVEKRAGRACPLFDSIEITLYQATGGES